MKCFTGSCLTRFGASVKLISVKAFVFLVLVFLSMPCFAQRYDAYCIPADPAQKQLIDQSIFADSKAIVADHTNPSNYYQRGIAEIQRSSFERQPTEDRAPDPAFEHFRDAAIADLTKVIALQPTNAQAYDQRGLAKEDYKADWQDDFAKAIELDPKYAIAYLHKGYNAGVFRTDAVNDFTTAIRLDPTCAPAYFYRAEAKQYVKNFEGTIDDLSRCISLNPQMVMPYQLRAYSEVEKGDLAAAEADWKKVTELRPDEAFWWEQFASIESRENKLDEAISDLNRAVKLDPHRSIYFSERANVQLLRGDYQAALNDYRASLNLSPEWNEEASTRFHIWECETQLGGHSAANRHLSHYLKTLASPWGDWDVKIGRFLLGKSDEKLLLASATDESQAREAQYYVGIMKKISGRQATDSKASSN